MGVNAVDFRVMSGTGIQEFVESFGSATAALDRVRALIERGAPNIRILREGGHICSLGELQGLLRQPQDDVGLALARAPPGAKPVDESQLEPNVVVTVGRALLLDADARGQGGGDRGVGGRRDGDADHLVVKQIPRV